MNELERQLAYPFDERIPAPGTHIEAAPGIRWARMRLPFALDHVNVWLLKDELPGIDGGEPKAGWTIIDTGIDDVATRADWEQLFAGSLDGLPVLRLIVTHMHPDHIGLAHWICERWNVRLWISATDFNVARLAIASSAGFGGPNSARFMARHGLVAAEAVQKISERSTYYRGLVPALPESYARLVDDHDITVGAGSSADVWRCHVGYGHAPEHMSFHCAARNVLISGDMVLPKISTNVSVIDSEPEADPLTLYLESIEKMRSIDATTLVLPSHGRPFKGLHTRIDQLQRHHADRFADVMKACAEAPHSAYDLVAVLFKRPLDLHQMTFAIGESIAHCHALWLRGELVRALGSDGVFRFETTMSSDRSLHLTSSDPRGRR